MVDGDKDKKCPRCHKRQAEWDNEGEGYEREGMTYCSKSCLQAVEKTGVEKLPSK